MPAKYPCAHYGDSCEVGVVEMHSKLQRNPGNFPIIENKIDILFRSKKSINKLLMYSWGKWCFVTDESIMRVDIHRYCPKCGHSVLMKMQRVSNIFARFTAYCADNVEFQGVDGSISNSLP